MGIELPEICGNEDEFFLVDGNGRLLSPKQQLNLAHKIDDGISRWYGRVHAFLSNGDACYVDDVVNEWCTGEYPIDLMLAHVYVGYNVHTRALTDLAANDLALTEQAVRLTLQNGFAADRIGEARRFQTRAPHENYMILAELGFCKRAVTTILAARPSLCGVGGVNEGLYFMSPRGYATSDYEASAGVIISRKPLFKLRDKDKPTGVLEVTCGDRNVGDVSAFIRFGLVSARLAYAHATDDFAPGVEIERPLAAIHMWSIDPWTKVRTSAGELNAFETMQKEIDQLAPFVNAYGTVNQNLAISLAQVELTKFFDGSWLLQSNVDWAVKLRAIIAAGGVSDDMFVINDEQSAAEVEHRFHDPQTQARKTLFPRETILVSDEAIALAEKRAEPGTRAEFRASVVSRIVNDRVMRPGTINNADVQWDHCEIEVREKSIDRYAWERRRIEFGLPHDPVAPSREEFDELFRPNLVSERASDYSTLNG